MTFEKNDLMTRLYPVSKDKYIFICNKVYPCNVVLVVVKYIVNIKPLWQLKYIYNSGKLKYIYFLCLVHPNTQYSPNVSILAILVVISGFSG